MTWIFLSTNFESGALTTPLLIGQLIRFLGQCSMELDTNQGAEVNIGTKSQNNRQ